MSERTQEWLNKVNSNRKLKSIVLNAQSFAEVLTIAKSDGVDFSAEDISVLREDILFVKDFGAGVGKK